MSETLAEVHPVIDLEKAALARWCNGDPSGFLEISAPEVVYFDPFLDKRMEGLEALTGYYEAIRGTVFAARYEMIEPKVIEIGDAAVLTFRFLSYAGSEGARMHWYCTEVYRRQADGAWRIVATHWSLISDQAASGG